MSAVLSKCLNITCLLERSVTTGEIKPFYTYSKWSTLRTQEVCVSRIIFIGIKYIIYYISTYTIIIIVPACICPRMRGFGLSADFKQNTPLSCFASLLTMFCFTVNLVVNFEYGLHMNFEKFTNCALGFELTPRAWPYVKPLDNHGLIYTILKSATIEAM